MTGGAGFVGMGRASNKNNLGMIGNRRTMGDNPYRGDKKKKRKSSNYDELKKWKNKKTRRMKMLRKFIFIGLIIIASTCAIVIYFTS